MYSVVNKTLCLLSLFQRKDSAFDEDGVLNDDIEKTKSSLITNDPTATEEYITETTQTISLKTAIKKIPKSLKQPSLVSISQTNSVTEDLIDVSIDKKSSGAI